MNQHVSDFLRQRVVLRAGFRCEYCRVPEAFLATTFHIDHIRSLKHGGKTVFENLCLACPHCNQNKGSDIATFLDEDGEELVRLFNPRKDVWAEHFEVSLGKFLARTPIGAATIRILDLNAPERIILRRVLVEAGRF